MQRQDTSLSRGSARCLEGLWLAAAIAMPLVCNPCGGCAFELPKSILLRTLVLLMALAALVHALETGYRPRPHPLRPFLWPVLALAAAFTLATACSASPRTSFWGSYERQQGLLTLMSYLGLGLLTAAHLRSSDQIDRLWAALVLGSVPVVAYGLLQAAGLDPLAWHSDAASRVLSTVGRANFLGSYLALVAPLTLGWALTARRRRLYLALLAAQALCLAATGARGAMLGLGVASVAFGLSWSAAARDRRPALTVLALALFALALLLLLNLPTGPLAGPARLPGLERLMVLDDAASGSIAARLTLWPASLRLAAARPWLGYGPETLRMVFTRVFPPQLVYYQGRQVAVDRAHNLWLDLTLSAGLLGAFAFGSLLAVWGHRAWRALRNSPGRRESIRWAALIAAIAGHLADLQFGFDLTTPATVLVLVLALGVAMSSPSRLADAAAVPRLQRAFFYTHLPIARLVVRERGRRMAWKKVLQAPMGLPCHLAPSLPYYEPAKESLQRARPGLTALLPYLPAAAAVIALIWLGALRPLLADTAYWASWQADRPAAARLDAARRAVHLWPLEPEYRLGLAWSLLATGSYREAEVQMAEAARLSPGDARILAAQGALYAHWAERDPAQWRPAEASYHKALALAPDVAALHAALGAALARQGRVAEALTVLERAVALDATDGAAWAQLAALYHRTGRSHDAARAEAEAQRWSSP